MTQIFDQDTEGSLDKELLGEFYFAGGDTYFDEESGDDLIWKDILREGEWAYRPSSKGPVNVPLKVLAGNAERKEDVGMQDILDAFDEGALDHVTVPTTHEDKPHENTGYVRQLKIVERDGKKYLRAGIEFTEPDIRERALRGSIPNTSAGIMFDYIKKESGKVFSRVLGHVALTGKPWINGMKPFGVNASEDAEIVSVEEKSLYEKFVEGINDEALLTGSIKAFARADESDKGELKAQIIKQAERLERTDLLPTEWEENLSEDSANKNGADEKTTVNEGGNVMTEVKEDKTGASPSTDSAPVELSEEQRIALFNEFKSTLAEEATEKDAENAELKAEVHKMKVNARISELQSEGYAEYPGLLTEIRNIMLADEGDAKLTLSEEVEGETKTSEVSVTGAVERLLSVLPKKNGNVDLGEQLNAAEDHGKPASETSELSEDERVKSAADFLGVELPEKDGDS